MQVWLVLNSQTSSQVLGSKVQAILYPGSLGFDSELDCVSQSGTAPWRLEQMCSLGFAAYSLEDGTSNLGTSNSLLLKSGCHTLCS